MSAMAEPSWSLRTLGIYSFGRTLSKIIFEPSAVSISLAVSEVNLCLSLCEARDEDSGSQNTTWHIIIHKKRIRARCHPGRKKRKRRKEGQRRTKEEEGGGRRRKEKEGGGRRRKEEKRANVL